MTMNTFKHILIVDDDPIMRAMAQACFEKLAAVTIAQAGNGREALEVLQHHEPQIDFILCDLNMPELDGVQFLRQLKAGAYRGAIAILSGEDRLVVKTVHDLARNHDLNIVGALHKPLQPDVLARLVRDSSPEVPANRPRTTTAVSASELGHAIFSGQIVPFYQPKVEVSSGRIIGAEALARWIHPNKGMINPGDFIPVAERCGLIGDLTSAILEQAMTDLKAWQATGISIRLAINIAADLLHDVDFPDWISTRTAAAGLSNSDFVLEVTESGILHKTSDPLEVLSRLRIKGFALSIDDFGTGHSNIEQLSRFPFCELKIDRSFVQGARNDRLSRTIIDASVLLARELDMQLVAEGVETEADWEFVAARGIDQIQGFYIAKPVPAKDFRQWHLDNGGVFEIPQILRAKCA